MTPQEKHILSFILCMLVTGFFVHACNRFRQPSLPSELPAITTTRGIDPNTASSNELQTLSGIGPVIARRIIVHRNTHGPFTTPDDLLNVKGIGPKKLEKIKPYITFTEKERGQTSK